MALQTFANGESGLSVRTKINGNFTTLNGNAGSDEVGVTQGGTGAVDRTLQDKAREYQTTQDFDTPDNGHTAAASLATGGFWDTDTPAGRLFRFADRVFIGDTATAAGGQFNQGTDRSWLGESSGGFMTYFESRATLSVAGQIGSVAIAAGSRSSDNTRTGELNTIGGGFYAKNDNTNAADKKSAWAIYGHAAHLEDNEFSAALELDTCSLQTVVPVNPYAMGASGVTAVSWFGVGGETAQQLVSVGSGALVRPVSVAIGIVNTAPTATQNKADKGIVFQSDVLTRTGGATGPATAIEMADEHEIVWRYSAGAGAVSGKIRADGADSATQQRLVFDTGAFEIRGVQSDMTTEQPLLTIVAPSLGTSGASHLSLVPEAAGTGNTSINAAGPDTNIDITIAPKGSGVVKFGMFTGAATTPANFTADRFIAIKDGSGTTYLVPCRATGW